MPCLFCQIADEEIPATVVYKRNGVTAFRDIHPQAPTHILIIPDEHVGGITDLTSDLETITGRLVHVAGEIARQEGIADSGFRLVINHGTDAGQSVSHLHVHLLGGRPLPLGLA